MHDAESCFAMLYFHLNGHPHVLHFQCFTNAEVAKLADALA